MQGIAQKSVGRGYDKGFSPNRSAVLLRTNLLGMLAWALRWRRGSWGRSRSRTENCREEDRILGQERDAQGQEGCHWGGWHISGWEYVSRVEWEAWLWGTQRSS